MKFFQTGLAWQSECEETSPWILLPWYVTSMFVSPVEKVNGLAGVEQEVRRSRFEVDGFESVMVRLLIV